MDEIPWPWFGELYYSLCAYKGEHVSQDILFPTKQHELHKQMVVFHGRVFPQKKVRKLPTQAFPRRSSA